MKKTFLHYLPFVVGAIVGGGVMEIKNMFQKREEEKMLEESLQEHTKKIEEYFQTCDEALKSMEETNDAHKKAIEEHKAFLKEHSHKEP